MYFRNQLICAVVIQCVSVLYFAMPTFGATISGVIRALDGDALTADKAGQIRQGLNNFSVRISASVVAVNDVVVQSGIQGSYSRSTGKYTVNIPPVSRRNSLRVDITMTPNSSSFQQVSLQRIALRDQPSIDVVMPRQLYCDGYSVWQKVSDFDRFQSGDVVTTNGLYAQLMMGEEVQAIVRPNEELHVHRTLGDWVGVSVIRNGRKIAGWIPDRSLTLAVAGERRSPIGRIASDETLRAWVNESGNRQSIATLVNVANGIAVFRRPDGTMASCAIESLSDADQDFIRQWTTSHLLAHTSSN